MDEEAAVTLIPRFWRGVTKRKRVKFDDITLGGFDTETFFGKVFATGFYANGKLEILHGLDKDHLSWFLEKCFSLTSGHRGRIIVGAHYLVFDLSVLLWPTLNPSETIAPGRAPQSSYFSILKSKTTIRVIWSRPCFAILRRGKTSITVVDSYSFYTMGLEKALNLVGAEVKKLPKPKALGKRIIPLPELRPYLNNDTQGEWELLDELLRVHSNYGIPYTLSLPMLSGQIFRTHYMKKDFVKPSGPLRQAAMLSYHGGKNSFVGKPGWYRDCYDLDINSAYPEAMRQLPNFESGKWVVVKGLDALKPDHSILRLTGTVTPCPWGSLFEHDFSKCRPGRVVGLWTTGYELREAVLHDEIKIESLMGYAFIQKGSRQSPFIDFVDYFYKMKANAKTPAAAYWYKLILNSLYGKFMGRTTDIDGNLVASSMFDPTVASLITAFVRAKVHRLEHKYKAIHTATDGFITQMAPDPVDCGTEMGRLKQVNFGPCLILRNKLYLHFDGAGKLKKSGLHGFEGSPEELQKLWESSKRVYNVKRLSRWSQAWHTGRAPGLEYKSRRTLGVPLQEEPVASPAA